MYLVKKFILRHQKNFKAVASARNKTGKEEESGRPTEHNFRKQQDHVHTIKKF